MTTKIEWTERPTCPHCGIRKKFVWLADDAPTGQDFTYITTCDHCKGKFSVTARTTIQYKTWKVD